MTSVWISHNPFSVETEIVIDGYPIAETSRLYKYIKTPMQDWVGNFLPMLIEHCNDDELAIVFEGLLHNYEDLDAELNIFLKKNHDYEIELQYQHSQGLAQRLAERDTIMAEMAKQDAIPRVLLNSLSKKHSTALQVLIFGSDERRCCELSDCLTSVYKEFNKMEIHQISELESVKQAIESEDKPILVCMVDEHSGEKENSKIINLISDAYKARGKINKWRYIFVADSPLYAKRILSSDFAIKNADVYGTDVPDAICQRIDAYRSEFWQIRKLADFSADLIYQLAILKQRLTVQAEQKKPTGHIDELEEKALEIVKSCWLSYRFDRTRFDEIFNQFCLNLQTDFKNKCLLNPNGQPFADVRVMNNVEVYIPKLAILVKAMLHRLNQEFCYMPIVEIEQNGNYENYVETLRLLGCSDLAQYIQDHSKTTCKLVKYPSVEDLEKDIVEISPDSICQGLRPADCLNGSLAFLRMCRRYKPHNKDYQTSKKAKYDYYTAIQAQICSVFLPTGNPLTEKQVYICEEIFNREINKFRKVFNDNLCACISQGQKEFQPMISTFDELRRKARADILIRAEEMREKAEISPVQKERLESIQKLLDRADALTKI